MAAVQRVGEAIRANVGQVIVGKDETTRLFVLAMLCDGHVLCEDVPGVGKTIMARAVAASIGCSFGRVQCTPDLLPSDVTGVSIYNQKSGEFEFRRGPIFAQIVLADEINRATPRTQSALLEAMAERQVSVDSHTYALEQPFMVVATQNPIEFEGTFPLPEAQLDRFFLRLRLGYPTPEEELTLLERLKVSHPIERVQSVVQPDELLAAQRILREVFVEDSVREYIIKLVHATRRHPDVELGASPRGSLALMRGSQALAALNGRDFVLPDDVKQIAVAVLAHRLVLKAESQLRRRTADEIIAQILAHTPVRLEDPESEAGPEAEGRVEPQAEPA
ncbi:MAG TPA: MoxR family ATPase [Limnochordia bacterium]|nr:MoxR family ATPase [Limnochordia bacterium]